MRHRLASASKAVLVCLFVLSTPFTLYAQRVASVFPQFASGGGWSSDIFVDNQGTLAATVDLSFFGDNGLPLEVESTLGTGSVFSFSLSGGNTKVARVTATGTLRTGYVVLSFPEGASIRASELFRYEQNGVVLSSLGVAQQFPLTSFSFPAEVDAARGINMGLALANGSFDTAGSTAQHFIVNLIKSDGTLQGTKTVSLGVGGHISTYLNSAQLFPDLKAFSGVVSVSAPLPFGLVALRQDQAVFGTVAVDAGPIVAPFILNTASTREIENNGSRTGAQTISAGTVIAGTISFAGDLDYFQFTGKEGDIVTGVVSTETLDSNLDSVLYLVKSDGTVFAQNDENGLFYQSDSFLQAVLPADGTYYLVVTDYSSLRGGFTFIYLLHFQLLTKS